MRLASGAVFLLIALVTLSPIGLRPETGLSPNKERFLAFLVLGALATLAVPRRRLAVAVLLVLAAGALEAAQLLVPGRHGRLPDFEVKALGAIVGVALAMIAERIVRLARSRPGR